ncbi:ComGF family competence protein [Ornithinibacillus halotolerans]|uniref:Competence protein ComGF n=1 Tax=Ornithinibacillus halotolerans TaxID=1274357 RepID=A0A916W5V2_9BACI|nr:ComGF family competence protein [Ornithinibacillus halotolerans]GGA68325.1 hypothetical protein GCM10008025_10380 [Ornithinibacillus halotolerans]
MVGKNNERAFTFYTVLLMITLAIICIHIYGAIVKTFPREHHYDEISIQQLFHFIQHNVNQVNELSIKNNKVSMTTLTGDLVSIEKYGNVIRRQVNNQGHEILLRNIRDFQCQLLPHGFKIIISSSKGDTYEKEIVFLPE